jgi:hypothetical protein
LSGCFASIPLECGRASLPEKSAPGQPRCSPDSSSPSLFRFDPSSGAPFSGETTLSFRPFARRTNKMRLGSPSSRLGRALGSQNTRLYEKQKHERDHRAERKD